MGGLYLTRIHDHSYIVRVHLLFIWFYFCLCVEYRAREGWLYFFDDSYTLQSHTLNCFVVFKYRKLLAIRCKVDYIRLMQALIMIYRHKRIRKRSEIWLGIVIKESRGSDGKRVPYWLTGLSEFLTFSVFFCFLFSFSCIYMYITVFTRGILGSFSLAIGSLVTSGIHHTSWPFSNFLVANDTPSTSFLP